MTDLTKFSKEDLKKTYTEIGEHLKKVDEKDFDPNQSTPDAAHLEDKIGGTSKKIEAKDGEKTEKSVETKKDFPPGNGNDEQMTEPTQGDVMAQILAMLKEISGKLDVLTPKAPEPVAPAPTDQIQQSATPPGPVTTPATTPTVTDTKTPEKGDININVTKAVVEEILKGMGITPSELVKKPKQETGHPIEKTGDLTYAKIAKMSWDEVHEASAKMNPTYY